MAGRRSPRVRQQGTTKDEPKNEMTNIVYYVQLEWRFKKSKATSVHLLSAHGAQ